MDLSQYTTDELDRALIEQLKRQQYAKSHDTVYGTPVSSHNPRIVEPYPDSPSIRSLSDAKKQSDYTLPINLYQPEGMDEVNRAKRQYQTDIGGLLQLGKMGAEAATMLPTVVSGGLAGGAALTGAKLGGATWDESLGAYNEASDAAKGIVQEILGQPSEFMELLSTHGFEPVNQYITQKSGDPRLGERLMDLFMMKGGLAGRTSKLAEFGTKAANTGLITGLAATQPTFDFTSTSDADLNKAALALVGGTMAVESRSPIKQQIFELQKAIRETADPAQKAELGRQIKKLQQSKPTQNLPAPVERSLIDPEGQTFQLKSLNAINQLKPEIKLNGPQLYKYLKRHGVSDAEITDVLGDIKTVGPVTTAARWASQVEQSAPKLNIDIYGGKNPITIGSTIETYRGPGEVLYINNDGTMTIQYEDNSLSTLPTEYIHGKPAPYTSYFGDEASKYNSDMDTYQVARVGVELPNNIVPITNPDQLLELTPAELDRIVDENGTLLSYASASNRLRHNKPLYLSTLDIPKKWSETEHSEITTDNPLGGFITSEAKLPTGEAITVMYEGQPPNIVKEQARSVEQLAKKKAAKDKGVWDELTAEDKETYLRLAKTEKTSNPVPEPLAERAMELAAKQMIAQAREAGHAGILLSTGEDVIQRWSSALQGVADEARYNPETQELKLYKNGSPSRAQSQVPTKVPPEKLKDYVGGQEAADRLLASEPVPEDVYAIPSLNEQGLWDINDTNDMRVGRYMADSKVEALNKYWDATGRSHVLTDLSIDKHWPTIEYGQFEKSEGKYLPGKIAQTLKRLTGGDIEMVEVNGQKKPFLRFKEDTPKTFSIYEWAAITGLSAAIIKQFVDETDENKQKMIGKYPKLKIIL